MTDLPNRQHFQERCEHSLERARRDRQTLALLFLDLDRFKHVNDSLGHPVGDELLRMAGQRLKDSLRQGDTVARLGGDEFIILLESHPSISDTEKSPPRFCRPWPGRFRYKDISWKSALRSVSAFIPTTARITRR